MILNSRILNNLDVSSMKTCKRCPGSLVFFTERDFAKHNNNYHNQVDQHQMVKQKLRKLESSRRELIENVSSIKKELKNLYKNNAAKKSTVTLLHREIESLKLKIRDTDQDIAHFKTYLKKDEQKVADPQLIMKTFKQKMDEEYSNLLKSFGDCQQASTPSCVSDSESVTSDVSVRESTKQRLTVLEQKVSEIDVLKKELTALQTSFAKSQDAGNSTTLEDLQVKSKELAESNISIASLKALLAQKERELAANQLKVNSDNADFKDLQIKAKKLEESTTTIANLKGILAEKEQELNLTSELNVNNQTLAAKEISQLQQKIDESSSLIKDLSGKNQVLVSELSETTNSLESASSTITKLTEEKENIENRLRENEKKLKQQQQLFVELQSSPSAAANEDFESKIQLLEERLGQAEKDLQNKMQILDQQDQELENAYSGQTMLDEQILCLCNEKDILNNLIEELKAEKEHDCREWKANLEKVDVEKRSLASEKQELVCQLKNFEKLMNEKLAMIEQLNARVKELKSSKTKDEEKAYLLSFERDEVKSQLNSLKKNHDRCFRKQEELKLSYEKSIHEMRRQMEHLLADETGTSKHLESKLEVQKQSYQSQISELESEISAKKNDIAELSLLLEDSQNQYQKTLEDLEGERRNFEKILQQLRGELLEAKASPSLDDFKIKELEGTLTETETKLKEISSHKEQLVTDVNDLKYNLSTVQIKLDDANQRIKELTEEQISLQEQHSEEMSSFELKYKEIERSLKEKEEELESLMKNRERQKDDKIDLQREIDQLKERLENEIRNDEELQKKKEIAEEKVLNLQQELSRSEQSTAENISIFKEQIKELEAKLSEEEKIHESKIDSFKGQIEALEKEKAEAKAEISQNKSFKTDNAKLERENKSMMLDLYEKNEINGIRQNEIKLLNTRVKELETRLRTNCAPNDRVIELSKELINVQEQCNDAVVECDVMSKRLKKTERELTANQTELKDYKEKCKNNNKSMDESQGRFRDTQRQLICKKASEERVREQLEEEKAKRVALEVELAKLKAQMQNEPRCSKAVDTPKTSYEVKSIDMNEDEVIEADYSSSFDNDDGDDDSTSLAQTTKSSISQHDKDAPQNESTRNNNDNNVDNDANKSFTEDTSNETSLPIDSDDDDDDEIKFSDVVQPMTNLDKAKFVRKDAFATTNQAIGGESEGVAFPKREWGEYFINEQTVDEDAGEVCEESVASLNSDESFVAKEKSTLATGSSSEDLSSRDSSSKASNSEKKNKKNKKKSKSLAPLKTDSNALPSLKFNLPSLKGKPLLGDLPALRGAPSAKIPSLDGSNNVDDSSTVDKPPVKNRSLLGGLLAMSKNRSNGISDGASKNDLPQTSQEIADKENGMSLLDLSRQASSKSSKEDLTVSTADVSTSASQLSKQSIPIVKSQKSGILGDLPPLPGSKSSVVMKPDIFGFEKNDENDYEDDEESFGDDDIDALLGDLDDFDAKRPKQ